MRENAAPPFLSATPPNIIGLSHSDEFTLFMLPLRKQVSRSVVSHFRFAAR